MPKRQRKHPHLAKALQVSDPMRALGEPHRLLILNWIAMRKRPVKFQEIMTALKLTKVQLSRILSLFEETKLVHLQRNADRTVTVTVNHVTLVCIIKVVRDMQNAVVSGLPLDVGAALSEAAPAQRA